MKLHEEVLSYIIKSLGVAACAAVALAFRDNLKILVVFAILTLYFLIEIFFGSQIAKYAASYLEKEKNKG